MIAGLSSRNFSNHHQQQHHHVLQVYPAASDDIVSTSLEASSSSEIGHANSLLYSLSVVKDKVNQVQSLVSILTSPDHHHQSYQQQNPEPNSIANLGTIIQEIIVTASSMMFTCQQMAIGSSNSINNNASELHQPAPPQPKVAAPQENVLLPNSQDHQRGQSFFASENFDWYDNNNYSNNSCNGTENNQTASGMHNVISINTNKVERKELSENFSDVLQEGNNKSIKSYDIIELDASYLLAKYTHYCQVCGKGFKRDANLRMHMRAHGDEYKTSAALSNPMKNINTSAIGDSSEDSVMKLPRKYSCPQEGCRWNQKHAKFQPLKSMICVKNHYKRSHCPKMYVCKRCNRKQFSVLSDLRTHEKHCGDLKWLCCCGTTFSRKDKLMGHVALFVGHTPAITSFNNPAKVESHQMQLDDRG
eukprot:XP_002523732.2 protein SENSITIVE TO PROTON RHIZOTOXICITY 2 [Ricinus communis]